MKAREQMAKCMAVIVLAAHLVPGLPAPGAEPASSPLDEPVPFLPTEWRVLGTMLELAEVQTNDVVMDLGCGDGRIAIAAGSPADKDEEGI